MIPYSLHVAIILAIWLLFYKLLLHRETYYRLNRIILLTCLLSAFLLPLIPVPSNFSLRHETPVLVLPSAELPLETTIPQSFTATTTVTVKEEALPKIQTETSVQPSKAEIPLMERLLKWFFWAYWCGVAIFGANMLVQLVVLLYQAYRKPAIQDGIYRIVEMDTDKAPCSFGNTIFINPSKYDWETYNQILIHEKVHIQQGHSFDLLLAELVLVLQWFNPFAWWYRKELESNLEFLTDDSVLHHHDVGMADYQLSLLRVSVPNFSMNITTNYNQSLLKKRIVMMNAKKSNVHMMWKYFMIMPLMVLLLCALNKPIAMGSRLTELAKSPVYPSSQNQAKGLWFAVIKDTKVTIEFKSDDSEENRRWSSSANFGLNDFPNLPKTEKADFSVTREAGTVVFNGKFDDDQGFGRYKFTPNKEYKDFVAFKNIEDMEDDEYLTFFLLDIKKSYIQFLNDNGFKSLTKNQIISMSAFKIDADYINYWKSVGYEDLSANNLVSLKSLKIDSTYVNDIRKAGYTDLTVQQLISFKSQRITGDYINSIRKASVKPSTPLTSENKPSPNEIIKSKVMKLDTVYVASLRDAGYTQLSIGTISNLKSGGVTAEYVKSMRDVGLEVPLSSLQQLKNQGITAEYILSFKNAGVEVPLNNLTTMKSQGITAEYIKRFKDLGIEVPLNNLYSLKSQGITPEFIKSYYDIGLKDISFNTLYSLKSQGLTAAYIKSFYDIGLKDVSFNTLYSLRSQGITPAFIKSYLDIGVRDLPVNTLYTLKSNGITAEFIKGFKDAGYKDLTVNQYYSLKSYSITPEFVKGFSKLGYKDLAPSQLITLKSNGITPDYVAEMQKKGFTSKDLNKYIQLKSFNTTSEAFKASFKSN